MKVKIKKFDVDMELKNNGVELDIYEPNGRDRLGDLVVTKTGLIWCRGRTARRNGVRVTWANFIEWMENQE